MAAKKEVEKLTPEVEQARQKLLALTSQKTYHSIDTEFGVLTVDASEELAADGPSLKDKGRRAAER